MLRSVLLCLDERSSGRKSLEAALRFAGSYSWKGALLLWRWI